MGLSFTTHPELFGQRIAINGYESIDAVFEKFEKPSLSPIPDSILRGQIFLSLHIATYVRIDTSGRVFNMVSTPLYGIGNDIPADSDVWEKLQASIVDASRYWVFKPLYYDTAYFRAESLELINQSAAFRPNFGRQAHLIIFTVYPCEGPLYDKIYGVDIYGSGGLPEKDKK